MSLVTEKGGIRHNATEESINVVRMLYRALKERNLFYTFQQFYYPLEGLSEEECSGERLIGGAMGVDPDGMTFGDVEISFPKRSKNIELYNKSQFWRSVCILWAMLRLRTNKTPKEKEKYYQRVSKKEILRMYAETYFSHYEKSHKISMNALTFKFIFGFIFLAISIVSFFSLVYAVSPGVFCVILGIFTPLCFGLWVYFKTGLNKRN